ncbi:type II toxin-antitoxin system YafO family toxin [Hahella chejuensis]|uniref:type II toxin-antitoxin system YafO family toxin n=1 Tax=Hahella chejuensis TaxID=158327 RepID=UPI000674AE6C|nr:type II toxin-antitoxin system YafO family toxin [Hahella chejuensis]
MSKAKKVWLSPQIKSQFQAIPELQDLIRDFIEYKKENLKFNDTNNYINIRYLIGRDVPYDKDPLKLEDTYHAHILEKGSPSHLKATRRYNFNKQVDWTSNYALVYCTLWSEDKLPHKERSAFGILDFWLDAHGQLNTNSKFRLQEMVDEFERAVNKGETMLW